MQHEHQSLLHKDKHLAILDQFSREEMASVKDALKDSYREYMILKKEMDGAITDEGKRLSEISFLQYQIEEIENANLHVFQKVTFLKEKQLGVPKITEFALQLQEKGYHFESLPITIEEFVEVVSHG